jgi:MFS family permease
VFINYVDRGTLPTAAHLIQGDLRLDDAQMGKLFSAFFWTYSLMQIPVGWIAERFGAHRVLALGLTLWASATVLTGFAHSFSTLLLLRLLLGLGESAGFPCMSKLLAVSVPPKGLGTANGIVGASYLFGPAIGTYVGGSLMAAYGWRSAFWVFGALSLLWLIPWSQVGAQVRAARTRSDAAGTPSFWMVFRHPAMWGTGLGLFSANYVFYFMLSWLPSYLERERGASTVEMAQLAGAGYLVNALAALVAGWAIDRWIRRGASPGFAYKFVMGAAHLGYIVCMLCMATGHAGLAIGAMFVYQFLCGASSPGVYAMSQILAGPRAAGRWVGIQNTMGSLAGVVSPWLTGEIVQRTHHFTTAFLLCAVMSVFGLIGWIFMIPALKELPWHSPRDAAAAA